VIAEPRVTTQRVPRFIGNGRIGWWERPVPTPGRGELLIRVRANALCGTDRAQFVGGSSVTPGHEVAGEVAGTGAATSTPVGTRGVVYLMDYCGACRSCADGATNQCMAKRGDLGFTRDGGFGQYALVGERQFFPVGAEFDFAEMTLLLDVMGTSAHALERVRMVRREVETLIVAGAGPVGLGVVAMARLLMGTEVTILIADLAPGRLALAERLGGTAVDLRERRLADALAEGRSSMRADAAIDTSGREAARRELLDALDRRGVLVCVGHGEGLSLDVSGDLIAPERAVMGSEYFRYEALATNLEVLRRHRDVLAQIITHRFGIEDLEAAYRRFLAGETGKVVVEQ
jgi:threonine 3-dehydrogenase